MLLFAVIGLTAGFVAGPIMSLPAAALSPVARTTGMGLFFTLYYVTFVSAPIVAGALSEVTGTTKAALYLGAACQCFALLSLAIYRRAAIKE